MFKSKGAPIVRDSGIELLRILLMLQVIFLHVCSYGNYYEMATKQLSSPHALLYWVVFLMSRCPVYVYIVIQGYFSVASKGNQTLQGIVPKVKKTYFPMLFYSLAIPLGMWLFSLSEISTADAIRAFFPVLSRQWYFMTLYLIVLVLSPFINRCLNNLTKKECTVLVLILFFIFSVWNMLAHIEPISDVISVEKIVSTQEGKGLYGFVFMYILGAFIRLHVKPYNHCKLRFLAVFVLLGLFNVALVYLLPEYRSVVSFNDNPISVLQGVCLLLFFRDLHFKSRVVNAIAALNLGVYMIHEHKLVRNFIWGKIFNFIGEPAFYASALYPFAILLICIAIFTCCALIEQLRVWLFALCGKIRGKILRNPA